MPNHTGAPPVAIDAPTILADPIPEPVGPTTLEAVFGFGAYLRDKIGPPPADMHDPHCHHTCFKKGNGAAQQALVEEGHEILRRFDIDPIFGLENLTWAPNRVPGQHSIDALRPLVEELRRLAADPFTPRAKVVRTLEQFGEIAKSRGLER